MRNAAERKDIRQAEKFARQIELARVEFIQAAMGTKQGRAWFFTHLSDCHIFADPFTGDALWEAFSKGERNIGLRAYNDIVTHCPDQFVMMMKEASYQEQINATRRSTADERSISEDPDRGNEGSGDTDYYGAGEGPGYSDERPSH